MLKSPDMKVPYNLDSFLSIGENKEEPFKLIKSHTSQVIPSLTSDHEEADTKIIAYATFASAASNGILIRSPSADIDIVVLVVCHSFQSPVFLDNGTGKDRKVLDVVSTNITRSHKEALIGVHSFSGNDYVSSFFRKGKKNMLEGCHAT